MLPGCCRPLGSRSAPRTGRSARFLSGFPRACEGRLLPSRRIPYDGRTGVNTDPNDEKSFEPQLLPAGPPTAEWGVEQLGVYAQLQHRIIVDGETSLAAVYWRLGHALGLARKDFSRGQWQGYLKKLGIDKTRASKARAIYRTFKEEEQVRGLSVDEAYGRRKRKLAKAKRRKSVRKATREQEVGELRTFFGYVSKRADALLDVAGFADPDDAQGLISAVRAAITRLEYLLHHLERQAGTGTANTAAK